MRAIAVFQKTYAFLQCSQKRLPRFLRYHPYVLRLYYGDDYCEYDFDFNYVGDYGGVRYTMLGDQLRWLFDMLKDDGEAVAWDEGGTFVS